MQELFYMISGISIEGNNRKIDQFLTLRPSLHYGLATLRSRSFQSLGSFNSVYLARSLYFGRQNLTYFSFEIIIEMQKLY